MEWEVVPSPSGGFRKGWLDGCPTIPPTSARAFLKLPACDDAATPFSGVVELPARTPGLGRAIGQAAEDQVFAWSSSLESMRVKVAGAL